MSKVNICNHVAEAIRKHAKSFPNIEIYGWLLGYDYENQLYVVASVPCKQYTVQSQLVAEPSQEEVMEISKAIPGGIGVVGIYHSHVGAVFHSATDDQTVKQFASVYPYFLSIVTNPDEMKYFQLLDEEVEEIKVKYYKENNLVQTNFYTQISVPISKEEFTISQISSQIREKFEGTKIDKILMGDKLLEDDVSSSKMKEKSCYVVLSTFQEQKRNELDLLIQMKLTANFTLNKNIKLNKLFPLIIQSLIDDMYYKLRNTEVKHTDLHFPERLELNIDDLTWKFYVNRSDQSFEDFVNLQLFRLKHMSFQNEKQRKKMIDRCINI